MPQIRPTPSSWRIPGLPWFLAGIAVALRLPSIRWGLPYVEEEAFPLRKAMLMGGFLGEPFTLDPATAGWPSLSFYVHMSLQHAVYGLGRLFGRFDDRASFGAAYLEDPTELVALSRLVGVLAAGVVVLVGARLARDVAGAGAALLVGLLLAASPLLGTVSLHIGPDILVALFAALTLHALVGVQRDGRMRDYLLAGLWIGLGASTKYTPAVFGASLIAVHVLSRDGLPWPRRLLDRRLIAGAALALATLAATSPYALFDREILSRDVEAQLGHLTSAHFGQEGGGNGHVHYLFGVLPRALGWPALLLGLAGLAWGARRPGTARVALAVFLPFLLLMGALSSQFDRWILPLLLPVALGLAFAWRAVEPRLVRAGPAAPAAAALVLLVAVTALPLAAWRSEARALTLPSTSAQLAGWMRVEFPRDARVVAEAYTLPLPPAGREAGPPPDTDWRLFRMPLYATHPELTGVYYDLRHYDTVDAIVTTTAVSARYRARPDLYPAQSRFYDDLETHTRPLRTFEAGAGARGATIRVYRPTRATRGALVSERGSLQPDFADGVPRLHNTSHFVAFCRRMFHMHWSGDDPAAAERYARVLVRTGKGDVRLDGLGALFRAQLVRGAIDDAEETLVQYLAGRPSDPFALACLGRIHQDRGQYESARVLLEQAVSRDRENRLPWARERLAELRLR